MRMAFEFAKDGRAEDTLVVHFRTKYASCVSCDKSAGTPWTNLNKLELPVFLALSLI
jgi:hypothetical protein